MIRNLVKKNNAWTVMKKMIKKEANAADAEK